MIRRVGKSSADAFFVDADCHPQTLAVLRTRAGGLGLKIVTGDPFRTWSRPACSAPCSTIPARAGR